MLSHAAGVVAVSLVLCVLEPGCTQHNATPSILSVSPTAARASSSTVPRSAVVWVKGLSCPLCAQAVKKELTALPGVENVEIDYDKENAMVSLSSKRPPSRASIEQAIDRSGYTLTKLDMQ